MKQWFLDLLFPKRCLGCGRFDVYICFSCQKTIKPFTSQICPVCTRQAIDGITHPGCQGRYELDGLSFFFPYDGVIRQVLRKYKYGRRLTDVSQTLVTLIYQQLPQNRGLSRFILNKPSILPVPLHWLRQLSRGFNHAELLGKELSGQLNLPFETRVLKRVRHTKPQYGLTKEQREKNIRAAFQVSPRAYHLVKKQKSYLLFDDVWTTGSTLRACANILKRAGAKEVWALAVAH